MASLGLEVIFAVWKTLRPDSQALPGLSWHSGSVARQDEGARVWEKEVPISRGSWGCAKCKLAKNFSRSRKAIMWVMWKTTRQYNGWRCSRCSKAAQSVCTAIREVKGVADKAVFWHHFHDMQKNSCTLFPKTQNVWLFHLSSLGTEILLECVCLNLYIEFVFRQKVYTGWSNEHSGWFPTPACIWVLEGKLCRLGYENYVQF